MRLRGVRHRTHDFDTGVVKGYIQTTIRGDCLLDECLNLRFLPDIDLDESGLTTCCDDFCNDGLFLALATTTDDDFGTCFTKSEDTSFADTAGRSDDEDDFVFEGFMRMLMGFGLWCQRCFV